MRVLFCGSRNWKDAVAIEEAMIRLNPSCVIAGGAKGADQIAYEVARDHEIPTEVYSAQWDKYGRAAGPIRNKQMLVEGKPDIVVAFTYDIRASSGTRNMVEQARKAGIPVWIYPEELYQKVM